MRAGCPTNHGSVSSFLPTASRLPPDEEDDDEMSVVPTRVPQQQRGVTPSPAQTVLVDGSSTGVVDGSSTGVEEYCEATQWGSQDTSFTAALSAIAGGPPGGGVDDDGLLCDGPDSNPISYGPDSQDGHPSTRFKRNYKRGGGGSVYQRAAY